MLNGLAETAQVKGLIELAAAELKKQLQSMSSKEVD
jgi:hypothetical protein